MYNNNPNNNPYGNPAAQQPYGAQGVPGYPQQPPYNNPPYNQFPPQPYPSQPGGAYPQQPQYPPQQPGPNYGQTYPPQQPPYQNYPPNYSNYPPPNPAYPQNPSYPGQNMPGQYNNNRQWDERAYLRKLFDEMDRNRDGEISAQELHECLKRGQTNYEFDPYTVSFLLEKYDQNRDNEIGFQEFHDLYMGLNVQYNEFLDIDQDSSGFIDGRELGNALRRRGYNFSQEIFDYVVNEIARRSGKRGISFDVYVRVTARFDFLRNQYSRSPYQSVPLEKYIRDYFF